MIDTLDKLDEAIVDRINTTECRSIRDVIRPFLLEKSEAVLRTRVRYLEMHKLIKTEKNTHGRVRCFPIENGKADVLSIGGATKAEHPSEVFKDVLHNDSI